MSKSSKRQRKTRRETPDRAATTDVVSQLECAIRHPQATLIGALIGGLVPWFARTLAHEELPAAWSTGRHSIALIMITVILGCACFSALTVYKFGQAVFGDRRKALGFTLAMEGVMLVSQGATSNVALAVLILINALANGAVIALAREATCRRREADTRRVATRARGRAGRDSAPSARRVQVETDDVVSTPTPRRKATVRWAPTMATDVVDAEIISEQKFLS